MEEKSYEKFLTVYWFSLEVAESLTNNADNDLEGLKIFTEDCEMEKHLSHL